MIKNVFKKFYRVGIFVLFSCLFGFSYTNASISWVNVPVGGEQIIDNSGIGISPDNNGNFNGYSSDILKNVIFWKNSTRFAFYYYTPDGIGYYNNAGGTPAYNNGRYGLVGRYQITGYNDYTRYNSNNFGYATGNTWEEVQSLGLQPGDITDIAYVYPTNSTDRGYYVFGACLRSQNKDVSICFWCNSPNNNCQLNTGAENIITYDNSSIVGFESIPDTYLNNSFLVGGGGSSDGTLIPLDSDIDMVISYYEQRGYRENMCYVGTDNLTATFGTSGISFDEGNGDSIFGLYNSIYSGFGNNIIQNVGKFINVRDINYNQWFYCDGENCPRRLAELTGNDVNINLNYTGLSFPFVNKSVAIYFMASNLSDTYNIDTHGMDVAFYCYSKLNYDSIKSGSIDYSEVVSMAGSGVMDKIDTYNQYLIDYYTPKGTFQIPTSGDFRNSFGSGEDYSGVNNTDMSNTFSNYFTRITNIFQNYSPAYSTGIIPDWIVFPLIFLLLFRVMKH